MNAALYIRVSTDDQLEFSPDAQKRLLLDYAKKNDMFVSEEHIYIDEGISGTSAKKRPAFMSMIGTAKTKPKPFDAILVHKFDRFARSREDSVVYKSLLRKECDIKVISITEQLEDDKFSVILEAMLEAMAEYYSLNLSDEVMKGMSEKARRGGVQSSKPYGYDIIDNKYVVIDNEASVIKLIFDKFVNQNIRYGEIAKTINNMGIRNKKGRPFENRNIKYILENPVYCGLVRWNYASHKTGTRKIKNPEEWILSEGSHEAIISKELFYSAQNILKNNLNKYADRKPISKEYKHWLGGLLRCASCGTTLTYTAYSKSSLGPNSKYKGYFLCNKYKKKSCAVKNNITVKRAEEKIIAKLEEDMQALLNKKYIKIDKKLDENNELNLLDKQLEKIEKKLGNAKKAYLEGIDTIEEYRENKNNILLEKNMLESKKNNIAIAKNDHQQLIKKFEIALSMIKEENPNIIQINTVLKDFISKIVIDTSTKTIDIHYFD